MTVGLPRPHLLGPVLLLALLTVGCGQYPGLEREEGREEILSAELVTSFGPGGPVDGLTSGASRGFDTSEAPRRDREGGRGSRVVEVDGNRVLVRGDGPLLTCPVYGRGYFTSSFGDFRAGPPVHPHQGNDVFAPRGTPIVAPFDGWAVATPNTLGGRAVTLYGPDGYVYNAHLSAYGELGPVELGQVIGYVGSTGNASVDAPHSHFEWHPGGGPAVDPFPFLKEACPPDGGAG